MIDSSKPINVWVNPNPKKAVYEIWVFELRGGVVNVVYINDGVLVRKEQPNDTMWIPEDSKPFMVVPFIMAQFLFPELITALSNKNFTPVPEATLKGELTATKLHLEDMQSIVKKLLKIA